MLDQTQLTFMINTLSKLGIEGNFLSLIKNIYEPTTDNILNNEKHETFQLRSDRKQKFSFSSLVS